jgi:hypothetical protein
LIHFLGPNESVIPHALSWLEIISWSIVRRQVIKVKQQHYHASCKARAHHLFGVIFFVAQPYGRLLLAYSLLHVVQLSIIVGSFSSLSFSSFFMVL